MPAPTANVIAANIEAAFIANGLVKYVFNNSGVPVPTTELTPEQQKMIKAIAEGISLTWSQWQQTQVVQALSTTPGSPIAPIVVPTPPGYLPYLP